jgi:hypothetical protein
MTNVLPPDRAELIMAEYSAGKRIYEIVAEYGHSPQTVRRYALGRRAPGQVTPREDSFAPFAAYCRRRLDEDPHLRAMPLLAEITTLGFPGTGKALYRALQRHAIRVHPCPDCRIARINGYALRPPERSPRPFPLAMSLAPVSGETMSSFLGRLSGANHASPGILLGALHPWFSIRNQWHDDRWQHEKLAPWAGEAAEFLAVACGSTALALKNALPAFGGQRGPVRATVACRLCAAAHGIHRPVPVHLPAHHQVCLRHGIWLSSPETPQVSVRDCPDILNAERLARRLAHRQPAEKIIYAITQAPTDRDGHAWKRRIAALTESNPRTVTEPSTQAVFQAADYPETVMAAYARCKRLREQTSPAGRTPGDVAPQPGRTAQRAGLTVKIRPPAPGGPDQTSYMT